MQLLWCHHVPIAIPNTTSEDIHSLIDEAIPE